MRTGLSYLFALLFLLSVSFPFVRINAETADKPGYGVRNGFSVTGSYLPSRYPRYDYHAEKWGSATISGFGIGLEYNISVPLKQSRWELRMGLGYSYSRIDEIGDKEVLEYRFHDPEKNNSANPTWILAPFSFNTYCEILREYSYVYLPVEIGYRLYAGDNLCFIPYMGLQVKYNIGLTEKGYYESATWRDYYFRLFDESTVETEAERFVPGIKAGVEIDYGKLSVNLSFTRDMERMYRDALIKSNYRGYWGPYSFNCWQLGLGINF